MTYRELSIYTNINIMPTQQRKNSLFFGSVKGIQNSAIYNTFIETCKQAGVSFWDYFCRLLRDLKKEERITKTFFP